MGSREKSKRYFKDTEFLKIQNEILTLYVSANNLDDFINGTVEILGKSLSVGSVYAYRLLYSGAKYKLIHRWSKENSAESDELYSYIPGSFFPHEDLGKGNILECNSLDSLKSGIQKSILGHLGINNFGAVPIIVENEFMGVLAFSNADPIDAFDSCIELLKSFSGLIKKAVSNHITQLNLTRSEEKYRHLFENMSGSFTNCELIYNKDGEPIDYKFLEMNKVFSKLLKVDKNDWSDTAVSKLMPNVEGTLLRDGIEAVKTGKHIENEVYSPPLDKYFLYSVFKSGKHTFAVISYDITEKIENEKKIIESEKKYRNLFDIMPEGFAQHEMIYNETGKPFNYRFAEINDKFKEILGMENIEWKDKTIVELFPNFKEEWLTNYNEVIKTGKTYEFENFMPTIKKFIHVIAYKTSENGFATITTDITKQKELEQQLASEKELLKITLESIGDGVITTDINGKITMVNKATELMTGYNREKSLSKDVSEILHITGISRLKDKLNPIKEVLSSEVTMMSRNYFKLTNPKKNKEYYILGTAAPIKDSDGNLFGAVFIFRDVTKDRKRNEEIKYLSMHDSLTGLYNRSFFEKKLKEFDSKQLYPFSVIMGDANGLKITNDVFGHNEGDRLLIKISQILLNCTSPEDIVARWGGDEFVILLPNADSEIAHTVCERITDACLKIEESNNDDFTAIPSISLGHSTRTAKNGNILKIVKIAEDLMYKKKLLESKSTHSNIIDSMKRALFEKSHETEEHAGRLSKYCVMLGKELDISHQALYDLELFSMLHDIGKVAVDESLLTKKEKLTKAEWEEIKRHPEIGYRIASSAPELSQVAEYILTHHEKWNGTGYPQGLSGSEIPIQSRILTIIDAFDAMTHDRPYRKALPLDAAINEITSNSGTQFDPVIVEMFIKKVLPNYIP